MKIRAALVALLLMVPTAASAQDPVPLPILDDVTDLPQGEGREAPEWPRTEAPEAPEVAPPAAPAPAAPRFTG